MCKILVTGATGNVGGALIALLREAGFTVFAGSTNGQRVHSSQGDGHVSFVDARDVASVAATVLKEPAAHAGRAYAMTRSEALTNSPRSPRSTPPRGGE